MVGNAGGRIERHLEEVGGRRERRRNLRLTAVGIRQRCTARGGGVGERQPVSRDRLSWHVGGPQDNVGFRRRRRRRRRRKRSGTIVGRQHRRVVVTQAGRSGQ